MNLTRWLIAPTIILALAGAGCAGVPNLFNAAVAQVANPVRAVDIYRAKNALAAAEEAIVAYRQYCWARQYSALMADPVAKPLCQTRRANVRAMKRGKAVAKQAVSRADAFVKAHPTLDAGALIDAAMQAIAALQATIPK